MCGGEGGSRRGREGGRNGQDGLPGEVATRVQTGARSLARSLALGPHLCSEPNSRASPGALGALSFDAGCGACLPRAAIEARAGTVTSASTSATATPARRMSLSGCAAPRRLVATRCAGCMSGCAGRRAPSVPRRDCPPPCSYVRAPLRPLLPHPRPQRPPSSPRHTRAWPVPPRRARCGAPRGRELSSLVPGFFSGGAESAVPSGGSRQRGARTAAARCKLAGRAGGPFLTLCAPRRLSVETIREPAPVPASGCSRLSRSRGAQRILRPYPPPATLNNRPCLPPSPRLRGHSRRAPAAHADAALAALAAMNSCCVAAVAKPNRLLPWSKTV